jgi:hypothetical protein
MTAHPWHGFSARASGTGEPQRLGLQHPAHGLKTRVTDRLFLVFGLLFALAPALAGCKGGGKKQPVQDVPVVPKPQEQWVEQPMQTPPQADLPVKQGSTPLVYLVESAAVVRVTDSTTGEALLRMPVAARTLVAVDASVGIRVGSATMKLGPLPADHQYAIFLESATRDINVYRQGRIRPSPPGQTYQSVPASTQPGSNP